MKIKDISYKENLYNQYLFLVNFKIKRKGEDNNEAIIN